MRVLVLTNVFPSPVNPHRATYNREQIRALAEICDVTVIAPVLWTDELAAWRTQGKTIPPVRRVKCDGITVYHPRYLYTPKLFRNWYGRFFKWSVTPIFRQVVHDLRPDVLFAPWIYPDGWAAVRLGQQTDLPVILKAHGSDVLLCQHVRSRFRRTREALRAADAIVTVSKDLARHVLAAGIPEERVHVVYNGVDQSVFHPGDRAEARLRLGLPQDEKLVLFAGNLIPLKGLDILLEAYSRVVAREPSCRLYVIGAGPLRASLEREIVKRGFRDRVCLVGARPNRELPDWYRAANVFVLPSRSEGIPTVLREAIACGTPFVASRVGGIAEIAEFGHNSLVAAEDINGFVVAIREHLRDPARLQNAASLLPTHADAAKALERIFGLAIESHKCNYREGRQENALSIVADRA